MMDLYQFNDNIAINALIKVAQNKNEDSMILNSCGESIASIWIARNKFDKECYNSLSEEAKNSAEFVIDHYRPNWLV